MVTVRFLKFLMVTVPIGLILRYIQKVYKFKVIRQYFKPSNQWLMIGVPVFIFLSTIAYSFKFELAGLFFKEIEAKRKEHSASVIWLHGLGDSGHGMSWLRRELRSAVGYFKLSLPTAPKLPITVANCRLRAWFDTHRFPIDAEEPHDEPNMARAVAKVLELVESEVAGGIPSERIVLGGFSQGAAVALRAAAKSPTKLGGVVLWSGYMTPAANLVHDLREGVNCGIACFCGHGDADKRISQAATERLVNLLKESNITVTSRSYKGMGHYCSREEMTDTVEFLRQIVPERRKAE